MGVKKTFLVAALLTMATLVSSLMASADPIPISGPPSGDRAAISIDGDSDFTTVNGVTGGSGTQADPFVIDSWNIEFPMYDNTGVHISNTRAYFVVRNVTVNAYGQNPSHGIVLMNVWNGKVEGCTITGTDSGIEAFDSRSIDITQNKIDGHGERGVGLESCSEATISGNTVADHFYGIWLFHSDGAYVEYNKVIGAYFGIVLTNCSGTWIGTNTVDTNTVPYSDDRWTGNTWPGHERVIDGLTGRLLLFGLVVPSCAALGIGAYVMRRRRSRVAAL